MVRQRGVVHAYFNRLSNGGVSCNFCSLPYKIKNSVKMTNHLMKCLNCPDEVRNTLKPGDGPEGDAASLTPVEKSQKDARDKQLFEKIRYYIVSLIKDCGRPIEMLDDQPFRSLMNILVPRSSDRRKLTVSAIQDFMNTTGQTLDNSANTTQDDDMTGDVADEDSDEEQYVATKVKGEKKTCTCNRQDPDKSHDTNCPMNTAQHYWAYFEVSVDDAKCKECDNIVKWSTMSDLKAHLEVLHPKVPFKDDDEQFTDTGGVDAQSDASFEQTDTVFLEDPFSADTPHSKAKKRKLPLYPGVSSGQKYVTLRDKEMINMEKFKSLDRFGLYVASLMKMLPHDKCVKFQEQIVNRLLREQAAAG